jgi:hypothetical protein
MKSLGPTTIFVNVPAPGELYPALPTNTPPEVQNGEVVAATMFARVGDTVAEVTPTLCVEVPTNIVVLVACPVPERT